MATYYVYHGGDGTTGASWATAYQNIGDAPLTTSGNVILVASDHVDANSPYSSAHTLVGPGIEEGVTLISTDRTDDSYKIATTTAITTTSDVDINLDGSFAVYGLQFNSNRYILLSSDWNEHSYYEDVTFVLSGAVNGRITIDSICATKAILKNCTVQKNCTYDKYIFDIDAQVEIINLTVTGTQQTSANLVGGQSATVTFIGCDLSWLTKDIFDAFSGRTHRVNVVGCKMPATISTGGEAGTTIYLDQCDSSTKAHRREVLNDYGSFYTCVTDDASYRDATYDGTNGYSLCVNTADDISFYNPVYTEWHSVFVPSTGSTTFTVYINQDGGTNLQDDEVWLEVEYFGNSADTQKSVDTDRVAIDGTPANQTTETSTTWTGITTNTRQKLEVTATVNLVGVARWRVGIGKQNLSDLFICPKIELS